MKKNKGAGLDSAIIAEALQNGGDAMADIVHGFCTDVFSTLIPPSQWTTSIIVPLPKKGDHSLMTNNRGISLLSITTKMYKILLNRILDHVNPILRSNQAGFCSGRSCAQQIHILKRIIEGFQDYQLPLTVAFIDFKAAFDSINRKVMFAVLRHRDTTKQLEKCSDGRWKHFRSLWCLYWCPVGWRSSAFPLYHRK